MDKLNKTTQYQNRYGDTILFTETSEGVIEMSGYTPDWMRSSYDRDFSDAYQVYKNQCSALSEPDYDLLVEDTANGELREMTYQEFAYEAQNNEKYNHYYSLSKPDYERLLMVDPSGGPYITIGTNLGRYFEDNKKRIVDSIQLIGDRVEFKTTNK